jgi:hypothetical protein
MNLGAQKACDRGQHQQRQELMNEVIVCLSMGSLLPEQSAFFR